MKVHLISLIFSKKTKIRSGKATWKEDLHLFKGDKHLFVRPWNGKQIEAQTQWPFQLNAIGIVAEWFGIDGGEGEGGRWFAKKSEWEQ